jgi:hypothetical protein
MPLVRFHWWNYTSLPVAESGQRDNAHGHFAIGSSHPLLSRGTFRSGSQPKGASL